MFNTDGTVGAFSDLPYFGPVESMGFYDLVRSFRLHKLPTSLMTGSREPSFFAEQELTKQIAETIVYKNGKQKQTCRLPEACTDFGSAPYLFGEQGRSLFSIRETASRSNATTMPSGEAVRVTVDAHGANTLWSGMILYLLGECPQSRFFVPNVDNYFGDSTGGCDFMLSLILAGASCIAHHFASKPECVVRVQNMSVTLTVLKTPAGTLCGDALQCFLESKLKVAVSRLEMDNATQVDHKVEMASETRVSAEDWLETVQNHLVEAHEDLCDERGRSKQQRKMAPAILVILPCDPSVRQAIRSGLMDCYTSEPIRFVEEAELTPEAVSGHTPVIVACSTGWLSEQARTPSISCILNALNVRQAVHTGFCELTTNCEEEFTHCFSIVRNLCAVPNLEFHSIVCESPAFSRPDASADRPKTLESCNMLLLFFRRFMMKYSSSSMQPFTGFARDLVLSERGWTHFNKVLEQMTLAGIVTNPKGTHLADHVELTVLGRSISFHLRMKTRIPKDELSAVDVKTILWAQLLRQPLHTVTALLQKRYPFYEGVSELVETLLREYSLRLDGDAAVVRRALVEQMAVFGFGRLETVNRTHLFLSSPSGSRKPLQNHYTSPSPTVCRGWFKQAPLESGNVLERKPVNVFCLPPAPLYCEVDSAQKVAGSTVQCPVEISYPIIIAHSILHIALHNNCVFVESTSTNEMVSLPSAVLQSSVLNALLDHTESNNAGIWLDNCCTDISLTPLDSSFLASVPLKGEQQIRVCERSSFHKKRKRTRQDTAEPEEDITVFKGVRPRSQAERDAIMEFVDKVVSAMGKDTAEKRFIGKKGFGFIDMNHELHPYYQHVLHYGDS